MRIVDVARELKLTSATAVRATDRLAARGWVERMSSPDDRKAVYVVTTDAGERMQQIVLAGVDRVATKYLWSRLTPEKCADIARAGHVVMADLQRREEAERLSSLGKLRPWNNKTPPRRYWHPQRINQRFSPQRFPAGRPPRVGRTAPRGEWMSNFWYTWRTCAFAVPLAM